MNRVRLSPCARFLRPAPKARRTGRGNMGVAPASGGRAFGLRPEPLRVSALRASIADAGAVPAHCFCEHFGFASSPTDPLHLFVLIKDLRRHAAD